MSKRSVSYVFVCVWLHVFCVQWLVLQSDSIRLFYTHGPKYVFSEDKSLSGWQLLSCILKVGTIFGKCSMMIINYNYSSTDLSRYSCMEDYFKITHWHIGPCYVFSFTLFICFYIFPLLIFRKSWTGWVVWPRGTWSCLWTSCSQNLVWELATNSTYSPSLWPTVSHSALSVSLIKGSYL